MANALKEHYKGLKLSVPQEILREKVDILLSENEFENLEEPLQQFEKLKNNLELAFLPISVDIVQKLYAPWREDTRFGHKYNRCCS